MKLCIHGDDTIELLGDGESDQRQEYGQFCPFYHPIHLQILFW